MPLGLSDRRDSGLGGWDIDIHHFYDISRKQIVYGSGSTLTLHTTPIPDSSGNYNLVSDDGAEVYVFNSSGDHIQTKQGLTGTLLYAFAYDTQGHLTTITDAYSNQTTIQRNTGGAATGIQAPYGQVTAVSIDANSLLTSFVNPNAETYSMTYADAGGLLSTFTKPGGVVSSFSYDSAGRLSHDGSSAGSSWDFIRSISGVEELITQTSAEGKVLKYDISHNPNIGQSRQQTDLAADSYFYQTYTDQLGVARTYSDVWWTQNQSLTNDARFGALLNFENSSSVSTADNYRTVISSQSVNYNNPSAPNPFDIASRMITSSENSKTWSSAYLASTGVTRVTSPIGRLSTTTTDSYGRPSASQSASYAPVSFSYDTHGRLIGVNQSSRSTVLAYSADGSLGSVTNPLSQITSYSYDMAGRLSAVTLPDLRTISYTYDSRGNLASVTPSSSFAHAFTFNGFDLISNYAPPALGTAVVNTQYAYNNDRQMTRLTRPDSQIINFNYDSTWHDLSSLVMASGNYTYYSSYHVLNSASTPDSITTSFTQYGALPYSSVTSDSSGNSLGSIGMRYSDFLRTSLTVNSGSGSTTSLVSFGYDNDNLLTTAGNETLTRSSTTGQITATALDNVSDTLTYDSTYGDLASYAANYNRSAITPTLLFSESYTRDALGRISANTQIIGGATTSYAYTYDSAGRLTAVTQGGSSYSSYAYDTNSNRTSGNQGGSMLTATYDAQDRLLTYNTKTYSYNTNGERISVVNTSPVATTTYTYDPLGNLKTVTLPSGSVVTYTLDALFRRISKKVGSTVSAYWVYDGNRIVAELDSSRVLTKRFIYSSKSNVPDYAVISGTRYRIVSDSIGSVRLVVNSSDGTIAQRIDYDEFGKVTNNTSAGFQPFGFAGGVLDDDTGLTLFGARTYDPETGRWLTKDPILFRGGDTNLYGYVMNDPINLIDPPGLFAIQVGGGAAGMFPTVGGGAESGIAISWSPGQGLQVGGYQNIQARGGAGVFGGLGLNVTVTPGAQSICDLNGTSAGAGFDTPAFGASAQVGDRNGKPMPSFSASFGPGGLGDAYGSVNYTHVSAPITFFGGGH